MLGDGARAVRWRERLYRNDFVGSGVVVTAPLARGREKRTEARTESTGLNERV